MLIRSFSGVGCGVRNETDFTRGRILVPLLRFMAPVFLALFLQCMYGAVDLLIVGRFATAVDVSAVSTGSQIMMTLTNLISSFAMGTTILLGQRIGEGRAKEGGEVIGSGICLFAAIGLAFALLTPALCRQLAALMNAPREAFDETASYIRICGAGFLFIIGYNLIGSIFRGIGDSRTPLRTVIIACVCNILGDLLLVAVLHMGAAGAALATVFAQAVSVALSLLIIRRRPMPFTLERAHIRFHRGNIAQMTRLGAPIALQDLLVGISFLVILAIVNGLGLIASAGVGVAQKVCGFIMLVPLAFMQAMSAFVAQNAGAGEYARANRALYCAVSVSFAPAVAMFFLSFWHGDLLAGIFANDASVVAAAAEYLKAYGIDCLLTCFLFCFIGYFNGLGRTRFVMIQGIVGAFLVRVPVSFAMSRRVPASMFRIGLATPASTVVQVALCGICFLRIRRKDPRLNGGRARAGAE